MAAIAAFFLRRPIKRLGAHRDAQSACTVRLLGLCTLGGFATAVVLGGWTALLWLTPALPLAGLFLHWDRKNESRATQANLAASSLFAFLPAAMTVQAGLPDLAALALCVLVLARSLPTVLIIRTYLRRRKGHQVIGPIFAAHIEDWPAHLEKIADFWSGVTGGPANYSGPMPFKHVPLGLEERHFEAWLGLWGRHCRIWLAAPEAEDMVLAAETIGQRLRQIIALHARPATE